MAHLAANATAQRLSVSNILLRRRQWAPRCRRQRDQAGCTGFGVSERAPRPRDREGRRHPQLDGRVGQHRRHGRHQVAERFRARDQRPRPCATTAADQQGKLDWKALAGLSATRSSSPAPVLAEISRATNIFVEGGLYLNSGFVVVLATSASSSSPGVALDDRQRHHDPAAADRQPAGCQRAADPPVQAYLFVGVGGADRATTTDANKVTDLGPAGDAGFYVASASDGPAWPSAEATGAGARKWIGIVAGLIGSMGVVGLPDAFSLEIRDLRLRSTGGPMRDAHGLGRTGRQHRRIPALFNLDIGAGEPTTSRSPVRSMVSIENFVYVGGASRCSARTVRQDRGRTTTTRMSVLTHGGQPAGLRRCG